MASKSYIKGYNFERKVMKYLAKDKWTVFRQPKSQFPDLISFQPSSFGRLIEAIECKAKYHKNPKKLLTKAELERAYELTIRLNLFDAFYVASKTINGKVRLTRLF